MKPSRLLQIVSSLGLLGIACYSQRSNAQWYSTNYTTDFENPPYTSGLIQGQDTWVSGTNGRVLTASEIGTDLVAGGLIAGTAVHGGNQALLDSGGGASINTTRVIGGIPSYSQVVVELWARPLGTRTDAPSLGNIFMTLEDASSTRAAAFRFGYDSATTNTHVDYADGGVGSVIWKSTGVPWDPTNTWYTEVRGRLRLSIL